MKNCISEISAQSEQKNEFVLPDYIPDVKKIAWYTACPEISGTYMNTADGRFEYEGRTVWTVLMICEDNSMKSAVFSDDFSGDIAVPDGMEAGSGVCTVSAENVSLRLKDPRRIIAGCRLKTTLEGGSGCLCPGDIADREDIEKLTRTVKTMNTVCGESSSFRVSEDIVLDGATPEIGEIILCTVRTVITEAKAMENKVMLSGTAIADLIYRTPVGDNSFIEREIPVSEMLDVTGCAEGMCCSVNSTVHDIKAQAAMNSYGENRILQLDFGWSACAFASDNRDMTVVTDAYSLEYETECTYAPCSVPVLDMCRRETLSVSVDQTLEQLGISESDRVLGVLCEAVCDGTGSSEDNKTVTVKGRVLMRVVSETYGQNGTVPVVSAVEAPFEKTYDSSPEGGKSFVCTAQALSAGVAVSGDRVSLKCDVFLSVTAVGESTVTAVTGVDVIGDKPYNDKPCEIILCYPAEGETPWDIAKRYHAPEESISAEGNGPYMITRSKPGYTVRVEE
ncbi:MAG: DUF3794 domain-containing protein [Clostridia bacterium]|nr:DUF3794 domain-containing protein [Clostridia bacterium]